MRRKMEKKILAITIAAAFAVSLAACGSSSSGTKESESVETASAEEEAAEVEIVETEEAAPDSEQSEGKNTITFEEQTVIDNDECAITITGIKADSSGKYTVSMNLENKSSDITYMFAVEDAYVNGVCNDPFFATEVAPGKQSNNSLTFSSMQDYGISEFTDIEIMFHVYDTDDWMADAVVRDTIHLYPYGEEASTVYERESQGDDIVLVDNDYVSAVVVGFEEDSIWGYTMNLFLENKTDSEVMFSVDNCSVNGYMADPFFASSVAAGKCKYTSMSWSSSTFEENGIEDVTEIEFTFQAYNDEDYSADDYVNETITLNP